MTTEDKITYLRAMNEGDDTSDAVLRVFLDLAAQKILNRMYQFKTDADYENLEVPNKYTQVQLNIAVYMLNKRGAEGEIQHIENGIHRNYGSSDVPDALLKDVIPFCQAVR